jgi:chromosome segregation ATPase
MELRQESLSSSRELIRRAGRDRPNGAEGDDPRKPQQAQDAHAERGAAIAQKAAQAGSSGEDWSGTLDLVLRASEELVASVERVRDLEVEVRELTESASQEIQQLRSQVADLQRRLDDAQSRRQHAEDWLRRLTEAVRDRFDFDAAANSENPTAQAS